MKHKIALVVLWISGSVAAVLLMLLAYSIVMACIRDVEARIAAGAVVEAVALIWASGEICGKNRHRR